MPDDGDAPRLIARLVALDPVENGADNVQDWIVAAGLVVFRSAASASASATATFGSITFEDPVQNDTDYDILVSGSCIVTAATAGLVSLGTGPDPSPDVNPIIAELTVAAATVVSFSAVVPAGYWLALTHSGTITVGEPVCVATPLNGSDIS